MREFIRVLFGYRYHYYKNLYPAYPADLILQSRKIEFAKQDNPLVSIIITVYNKLSYTYNCLQCIKDQVSPDINYEVIIVDDCSTDETSRFFKNNARNIEYIRNEKNIGYLQSNNKASEYARGKYICFLNNDTEVQAGWLESMVELIESDIKIGCVGSKLLYPNNLLQEAGGIIFKNGHGANFGRMKDPDDSSYNFIREVDYCSAASILVKKDDFIQLGGFDVRFAPAYYEDTDLCFGIRNSLKKKVMYHPLSRVIHFEGISSGKEVKEGSVKQYQEINHSKFQNKWSHVLCDHGHPEDSLSYRRLITKDTIVVIGYSLPSYDKDSGSLRLYRILDLLISLDYHVIFIPEDGQRTEPYYSSLIKMGIEVRFDFNSSSTINDFKALEYLLPVKFVWISMPSLNEDYEDKISYLKTIKWIYDTVDLHHIRMSKESELTEDNTLQLAEAKKMKDLEIRLGKKANASVTVTEIEKQLMEDSGVKNVYVVPNIHLPYPITRFNTFNERSGLLFIGGYNHSPNVDAVSWLVKEVMPIVWETIPGVPLYLLGSNPTREVLNLANNDVIVPGFIEDVSSYFLNSRVFVAPLRYGAGMKGKVGQSLEFRLPIVTTSIGAEGMGLEDEKHLLIANDKFQFASQILRVYKDRELWENISSESERAISRFSPQAVREQLKELLNAMQRDVVVTK